MSYILAIVLYLLFGLLMAHIWFDNDDDPVGFGWCVAAWPIFLVCGAFVIFIKTCIDVCGWLRKRIRRFWKRREKRKRGKR